MFVASLFLFAKLILNGTLWLDYYLQSSEHKGNQILLNWFRKKHHGKDMSNRLCIPIKNVYHFFIGLFLIKF